VTVEMISFTIYHDLRSAANTLRSSSRAMGTSASVDLSLRVMSRDLRCVFRDPSDLSYYKLLQWWLWELIYWIWDSQKAQKQQPWMTNWTHSLTPFPTMTKTRVRLHHTWLVLNCPSCACAAHILQQQSQRQLLREPTQVLQRARWYPREQQSWALQLAS